LKKKYIYK